MEIARVGTEPTLVISAGIERAEHNTGVFSCQFVGRLPKIDRSEGSSLPEFM